MAAASYAAGRFRESVGCRLEAGQSWLEAVWTAARGWHEEQQQQRQEHAADSSSSDEPLQSFVSNPSNLQCFHAIMEPLLLWQQLWAQSTERPHSRVACREALAAAAFRKQLHRVEQQYNALKQETEPANEQRGKKANKAASKAAAGAGAQQQQQEEGSDSTCGSSAECADGLDWHGLPNTVQEAGRQYPCPLCKEETCAAWLSAKQRRQQQQWQQQPQGQCRAVRQLPCVLV